MHNHRTHFARPHTDSVRKEVLAMKLADQLEQLARRQAEKTPRP